MFHPNALSYKRVAAYKQLHQGLVVKYFFESLTLVDKMTTDMFHKAKPQSCSPFLVYDITKCD